MSLLSTIRQLISDYVFFIFLCQFNYNLLNLKNLTRVILFFRVKGINWIALLTAFPASNFCLAQMNYLLIIRKAFKDFKMTVFFSHCTSLFTFEWHQLTAKGRHLEHHYKRSGLGIHKGMYANHIHHYKDALSKANSAYCSDLHSFLPPKMAPCEWLFFLKPRYS